MIVVVGQPLYRESEAGAAVDGLPARIALVAAGRGRSVQLVGKAGEDEAGDVVVHALAHGHVGHAALLREAGRPTLRAVSARDETAEAAPETPIRAFEAEDGPPVSGSVLDPAIPGTTLLATDVDLALRYLIEFAVLVLADPATPEMVRVATDASTYAGAALIVVVPAGEPEPGGLPPDAIVFEAPDGDPDGVFASMVGSFAAALDGGGDPAEAFRSSIQADGWTASPVD